MPSKTLRKYFHIQLSQGHRARSAGTSPSRKWKDNSLERESDSFSVDTAWGRPGPGLQDSRPAPLPIQTPPLQLLFSAHMKDICLSVPSVTLSMISEIFLTVTLTWRPRKRHLVWTVTWRSHPPRINSGYPSHFHVLLFKCEQADKIYVVQSAKSSLLPNSRRWGGESEREWRQESNLSPLQGNLYNFGGRDLMGESFILGKCQSWACCGFTCWWFFVQRGKEEDLGL